MKSRHEIVCMYDSQTNSKSRKEISLLDLQTFSRWSLLAHVKIFSALYENGDDSVTTDIGASCEKEENNVYTCSKLNRSIIMSLMSCQMFK